MLEVKNLTVTYGATVAVDDASLKVDMGEALVLLGANGAGKTSTLRPIPRPLPSRGTSLFDGADLTKVPPEEVTRRELIHVPEGRHVFGTLTGNDNLLVGMTARSKRTEAFSLDDVYDLLPALVALEKRLGWALSGGEQQMVAVGDVR